jgi:hypothetical protein
LDDDLNVLDTGKGVRIFNYVTEGSFDAYMWQAIEAKAKAIKSLLRRTVTSRSIEDADELVLSASEAKALASGNPDVLTAVRLKNDIHKLQIVAASRHDQKLRATLQLQTLPKQIASNEKLLVEANEDLNLAEKNAGFSFKLGSKSLPEKDVAGAALAEELAKVQPFDLEKTIGEYRGFKINVIHPHDGLRLILKGKSDYVTNPITEISPAGLMTRLENTVKGISTKVLTTQKAIKESQDLLAGFTAQQGVQQDDSELMRLKNELSVVEHRLKGTTETPAEGEGFTYPPNVSEYGENEYGDNYETLDKPRQAPPRMPVYGGSSRPTERAEAIRERLAATQSRI